MPITFGGECPCCQHVLLQQRGPDSTFEACVTCGFAYGTGVTAKDDGDARVAWFYVWRHLFGTYGATSRRELLAKLAEAGIRPRSPEDPPPPRMTRRTIFAYELGHLAATLAASHCPARHDTPCPHCVRFDAEPLATQILADIARGRLA